MKGQTRLWLAILLAAAALGLGWVPGAVAGLLKGDQWRKLPENGQMLYVWGVVDGWQPPPLLGPHGASLLKHYAPIRCVEQMTYGQIMAIVKKYVEENPAKWHFTMSDLVWNALENACLALTPK